MEHSAASVTVLDVSKSFPKNGTYRKVLRSISIALRSGEFTTLVGANGCGKTTLLNVVAGLVAPEEGTVSYLTDHGEEARIGYVWQNYRASMLPWMTVAENIAFPLRLAGLSRGERRSAVNGLLARFLKDVSPEHPCYELSGGQQQLVCILRSLTVRPDVLLLDEPFSALDQQRSWQMALYVEELWRERQPPVLFVSHDLDEAILLADRILLMSPDGRIAGSLSNALPRPRSLKMLTAAEHLRCRSQIVRFFHDGRVEDKSGPDLDFNGNG